MRANYRLQRLFVDADLASDTTVTLPSEQSHYLAHVLRMVQGAELLIFNGRDGEWRAVVETIKKRSVAVRTIAQERPQTAPTDLVYCFAPLKAGRLDYMVQKAVEMGAGALQPVLTQHTQLARIGLDRLRANVVEAAEQCGVLAIPPVHEMLRFDTLLAGWDPARRLIFCDEAAEGDDPQPILRTIGSGPLALLVGPEGGFSESERRQLHALPFVSAIPLGPRILRADTAAVAALAVIQAMLGDWRGSAPLSRS